MSDSVIESVLIFSSSLDLNVEINYNKESLNAHWSTLSEHSHKCRSI